MHNAAYLPYFLALDFNLGVLNAALHIKASHSTTDKERGGGKAQISREMCGDGRMWQCEVEEDRKGTEHRNKQVFWRGVAVAFS